MRPPSRLPTLALIAVASFALAVSPALVGSAGQVPAAAFEDRLAPFVPTPQEVVDRMLQLADVKDTDVVYDLGCGDGRLVITAAKTYGARGVGIDIDPARISESKQNAKAAGVEHLVQFHQQNALTVDVSPASVVTLYLLPDANLKLRPTLQKQLKPGSRVVSHQFSMGEWVPDRTETMTDSRGTSRVLYLWTIKGA